MEEVIYHDQGVFITEYDFLSFIGENLRDEDYETAAKLIIFLNKTREKLGHEPYSLGDIFFMNYASFVPESKGAKESKCIYVAEFTDGIVKIGISKAPEHRIKTIAKQRGFGLVKQFSTAPIENASDIECELHKKFAKQRLDGECFRCQFEDVIKILNDKYKLVW